MADDIVRHVDSANHCARVRFGSSDVDPTVAGWRETMVVFSDQLAERDREGSNAR